MNPLAIFSSIIESDQSPWRKSDVPAAKYKQLLEALPVQQLAHHVPSVPIIPAPLVPIQQYFVRQIQNAFTTYLNELLTLIKGATIELERNHYITTALEGEINQQLLDTATCFEKHNLVSTTSHQELQQLRAPAGSNNDAYIINVLKFHLLAIAINIRELYPQYIENASQSPSDLHQRYFYQLLSDNFFEAPKGKIVTEEALPGAVITQPPFEPVMNDLDDRKAGPIPFSDIIESEHLLKNMELHLYEAGYLTAQYTLTSDQVKNVKREIAALMLEMECRGGFKKIAFVKHKQKPIGSSNILAFFNARYNTNLTDILNGMRRKDDKYNSFYEQRGAVIKAAFNR